MAQEHIAFNIFISGIQQRLKQHHASGEEELFATNQGGNWEVKKAHSIPGLYWRDYIQ